MLLLFDLLGLVESTSKRAEDDDHGNCYKQLVDSEAILLSRSHSNAAREDLESKRTESWMTTAEEFLRFSRL